MTFDTCVKYLYFIQSKIVDGNPIIISPLKKPY